MIIASTAAYSATSQATRNASPAARHDAIGYTRWQRPVARNDHTDAPAPVSATGYADGRMIPPLWEKSHSKHDKTESRGTAQKDPAYLLDRFMHCTTQPAQGCQR